MIHERSRRRAGDRDRLTVLLARAKRSRPGAYGKSYVHQVMHHPVLVEEVMEALRVRADGIYVDATCGPGGHAAEILRRLGPRGRLLALDRDPRAVAAARARFADDGRVVVTKARFSMLQGCVNREKLNGRVDGILFDLGISSAQLNDSERGFSFQHPGPLDMRMDCEVGVTAAAFLSKASEREIAVVLRDLGEERYARRIARAIVGERARRPIETTSQLAQLVSKAAPTRERSKNPATRTFLALRLLVNEELDELRAGLHQALRALAAGGRLTVISFHSLEDRIVKRFMRAQARGEVAPDGLPVTAPMPPPRLRLIGRAIRPRETEIRNNARARSAVLRVAERTEVEYA
jgi:16S rRNA (cytosine1402-N4)-methyltransferase